MHVNTHKREYPMLFTILFWISTYVNAYKRECTMLFTILFWTS